ncbi:hypothetical protein C5C63_10505 [Rathayibacter sp. AY1B8]|nr:hypothetical protein C5C63_10505 [Rathayibacter sp. AY1B8]
MLSRSALSLSASGQETTRTPPPTGSFSHGRRFALVHIPSTNHCTLVIAAEPDGARWSASPRKPALRLGPHPAAPRIFG